MPKRETILLIEDEEDFRAILRGLLTREGYTVRDAGNGEDGLKRLREAPPDLILLDLNLPDMGGVEICRKVRAGAVKPGVPIVVCTVRAEIAPVAECLAAGANDYVVKPFEIQDLLARIRTVLDRSGDGAR